MERKWTHFVQGNFFAHRKSFLVLLLVVAVIGMIIVSNYTAVSSVQPRVTYDNTTIKCHPNSPFVLCPGIYDNRERIKCVGDYPNERCAIEPSSEIALQQNQTKSRDRPYKVLLLRRPAWLPRELLNFGRCAFTNCVSASAYDASVDVMVVHGVGLDSRFPLPKRYPNQAWIFATWEAPPNINSDLLKNAASTWNYAFNGTMGYRLDSDIFIPYSRLEFNLIPLEQRPNYYNIAMNKSKSVAWVVSNCETAGRRERYVKELQKYIDVSIYGGCGSPCRGDCFRKIPKDYRFYLSFENSLCLDYLTEKFYRTYDRNNNIIPVVRGGIDYNRYFPQGTFINTADFPSPKALAEHLKGLGSDPKRYAHMLEVKAMYTYRGVLLDGMGQMFCQMCEQLNRAGGGLHAISRPVGDEKGKLDMKKYLEIGNCWEPKDLTPKS